MQIARLKSGGAINRSFFKHQSARDGDSVSLSDGSIVQPWIEV